MQQILFRINFNQKKHLIYKIPCNFSAIYHKLLMSEKFIFTTFCCFSILSKLKYEVEANFDPHPPVFRVNYVFPVLFGASALVKMYLWNQTVYY